MRMKSMNRHTLMGLAMIPAILIGCQDFLAEEKSEAKKPSPSTQELALQTGDSQDSIDCAALEARLTAAFNNPAIYYPIKDSLYKFCWITPPPPPPDTLTLCKNLVTQMQTEKALTLPGYYQPIRDGFDAMNCAQLVGPAPAAPSFTPASPAPAPVQSEPVKPEPATKEFAPQTGDSIDCAALEARLTAAFNNPAIYYPIKDSLYKFCWVTPPPPPPDTTSLCKGLVSQMTDEKSLTLEGYYQFSRDKFDAMNCAQLVGPAPAAPTFSSTKSVQTPEISKPAPVVETTQPLDGSEFCRGLQEKMESELARNDVTYYLQLKTLFGENSCTWVTVQNPTPVSTPPSDPCVSAYQSLATVEPDSPKALSLKTYIAEKCPAKP